MTLEQIIQAILNGAKRIDSIAFINNGLNSPSIRFNVKCYTIGENIRIDLEKVKE